MSDILVTTPKSESKNSENEALDCIKNNGGYYFRYFRKLPKNIGIGSKVFYVDDGYIRGFSEICEITNGSMLCETTGKLWPDGFYAIMLASSWKWIKPLACKGFQGFRYVDLDYEIVGSWKDKKSEIKE